MINQDFTRKYSKRFTNRIIENETEILTIISQDEQVIIPEWMNSIKKELILKIMYSNYASQVVNSKILNNLIERADVIERPNILLSILVHHASVITLGASMW